MAKGKSNKEKTILTYTPGRLFQVKLRGKRLAKGKISLYLDHYRGQNSKRETEFLNLIIKDNPITPQERGYNREQMELAFKIREKRESNLKYSTEGLISPHKKRINFLDYYQAAHAG